MSEFKGVTVVKKANIYFDGKVTSRTVIFADGSKKTLGIMLPASMSSAQGKKNSWRSCQEKWKCCFREKRPGEV